MSLRPYALLTKASVVKIGEELDAEQVIFGQYDVKPVPDSPTKSRGSLQITARVLDLKHVKQGPEFRELGALEDLAALQEHLAWQALRYLKPVGAPSEAEFRERHPAVRVDAVENYTRGLLAANADDKHRFFTQAARLDTHYSLPDFQLGRLFWSKKEYSSAAEWFQKVAPGDIHYHEANFFLGLCRYQHGRLCGRRIGVPDGGARGSAERGVQQSGGSGVARQSSFPPPWIIFAKLWRATAAIRCINSTWATRCGGREVSPPRPSDFTRVLDHDPDDAVAALLLERCEKRSGPRPGDSQTEGLERLKTNYEESAYWQLKAVLQPDKP